jgi:hypothetical protein
VRMELAPRSSFISLTTSTASWVTSRVFAHARGSLNVFEKTPIKTV